MGGFEQGDGLEVVGAGEGVYKLHAAHAVAPLPPRRQVAGEGRRVAADVDDALGSGRRDGVESVSWRQRPKKVRKAVGGRMRMRTAPATRRVTPT